ncbi:MAG: patatin-like phospholipase family protein [Rhodanobacter sp.]|nr:MAG: patatin-like phospholipase family protein [Rhodanobacter sp.]TAM13804.1 MAG: patatin-like phospholipase family protein [Rhodanobacter sp.]TAM37715.1 MAG: patatin-like phospholipase family protein [Rhodanobacter sp.]
MPEPTESLAAQVARDYQDVALVLQGGGALGAYQAGVVEALAGAGVHPHWVAGISIGALNAAIIAGNPPERRVEQLHAFWDTICTPPPWLGVPVWFDASGLPAGMQGGLSSVAAWSAVVSGQKGFFRPRMPPPFLEPHATPNKASWYDTTPLRATLERLADFDRINDPRQMHVSVGAVNVRTGNFVYFDNTKQQLRPEHFMASGALPPGFAAVEIDGEYYWDGGMVSNTPLYRVLHDEPERDLLVFQVDLWSARGEVPHDLAGVADRGKEIQYSSRTRLITDAMREARSRKRMLRDLMALVPPARREDPAFLAAAQESCSAQVNLIHLIYRDKPYEGHFKDYEFSAASMRAHWQAGMADMQHTLDHPQWFARPSVEQAFVTHDVHRG